MIRESASAAARSHVTSGVRKERGTKRWWQSGIIPTGIGILVCAALCPRAAYAVLGAPADSVTADQARMEGHLASSKGPNFTVEQISTSSGTVVNEYVAPTGTVFAISWRGPRPPDLSQLFGSYFAEYQAAAAQARPQRRQLEVTTGSVVVEATGHMRDLRGRAYVPSLIPAGVTADEIQ
jgi:Protein of unknown function (DUF2844)